jgi:hypothetical protein
VNYINDLNAFITEEFDINIYQEEIKTLTQNGTVILTNTNNIGSLPSISISITSNCTNPIIKINSGSNIIFPFTTLSQNDVVVIDSDNRLITKNDVSVLSIFNSYPSIKSNTSFSFQFICDELYNFPITLSYVGYSTNSKLIHYKSNVSYQKNYNTVDLPNKYYNLKQKSKKTNLENKLSLDRNFVNDNMKSYVNDSYTYHMELIGDNTEVFSDNIVSYIFGNVKFNGYNWSKSDSGLITEKFDAIGSLVWSGSS